MSTPRPDLAAYFKAQIKRYAHGDLAPAVPALPADVAHIIGTVTSPLILVVMRDNTLHVWKGGKFAQDYRGGARRVLMPVRIDTTPHHHDTLERHCRAKGIEYMTGPRPAGTGKRKKSGRRARIDQHAATGCTFTRDQIPAEGACPAGAPADHHPHRSHAETSAA